MWYDPTSTYGTLGRPGHRRYLEHWSTWAAEWTTNLTTPRDDVVFSMITLQNILIVAATSFMKSLMKSLAQWLIESCNLLIDNIETNLEARCPA